MLELYDYLTLNNRGKDNRIKGKELMKLFNIKSDKALRKLIQNINASQYFNELIGAVSGKRGGYFTAITDEEEEEVINNRKHRANQMLRECHIMQWKANLKVRDRVVDFEDLITSL